MQKWEYKIITQRRMDREENLEQFENLINKFAGVEWIPVSITAENDAPSKPVLYCLLKRLVQD
ncbi:MAG: hypothetical protein ACW98I_04870 [Candidatus Hodarchaeales archaeon]|jgi:hypothetical protein